jgi:FAD/FMN-containing dehydrogenase
MLLAEVDGDAEEVRAQCAELSALLGEGALGLHAPEGRAAVEELWRWRDGVSLAVAAQQGGKLSEDIAVPLDRFEQALAETLAIGARHGLVACSWGHAGDGNLHACLMLSATDPEQVRRGETAAQELFELARRLGGSVSGEHGLGWIKRGQLERQSSPAALRLHRSIKAIFDPKGLLNPGKKDGEQG